MSDSITTLPFSAKLDIAFKKLFTEHVNEFRAFLSDMLELPGRSLNKIQFLDTELKPSTMNEKLSRLDIRADVGGKHIDVEIQIKNNHDYRQRSLFYWAKLYTTDSEQGERYDQLRPAITLNLLDYTLFPDRTEYHATVKPMFTDTHATFSEHQIMHFFELSKVKFPLEMKPPIGRIKRQRLWLLFLNATNEEELQMIESMQDPNINAMILHFRTLCHDATFKHRAINRQIEILDYNSDMYHARQEGIEIGRKLGIEIGNGRGRANSVRMLMQNGHCDQDTACQMLGISEAEKTQVLTLLAQMQAKP